MSDPTPWERLLVGSFAGAFTVATVLTVVVVAYALLGYEAFDSLGINAIRFLFVLAPIVAGLAGAVIGAFWPDLIVRALGRLWNAIVGLLQCM